MNFNDVMDYDALWDAGIKCMRSVGWKNNVKYYKLHMCEETLNMCRQIESGKYKMRNVHKHAVEYPKPRTIMSLNFKDRIYQRCLNDNILYPEAVKHFVIDNCACQIGKGGKHCYDRVKKHLWNHYSHYGNDGYILQIDIKGYYSHMTLDTVMKCFSQMYSPDVMEKVAEVLAPQRVGDGFVPGSQLLQIAGISLLNPLDHYIKERLHVKHYARYMDDFLLLFGTLEEAEYALDEIKKKLGEYGFEVNEKKTHIIPFSKEFQFLGYDWRVTKTGKIMMVPTKQNIKHTRKKIVRMNHKGVPVEKSEISLRCWVAHADQGRGADCAIENMRKLWRDVNHAQIQAEKPTAEGRNGA